MRDAQDSRTRVATILSVRREVEAIAFYKAAFGAEEVFRVGGGEDGGAVVPTMSVGRAEFWLADESPEHANFGPESLGGSTVRMMLVVADPDGLVARATGAGATVVWPVEDQPYGWRVGRVADPFGHHWEIGRPLG